MNSIAIGVLALGGDHRKLFEIIPDHVKQKWSEWAPEGLVLISVVSQIVLFLLGDLRKHNPRTRIRIALWSAYLLAYAVASGALSVITRSALDVCSSSTTSNQNSKYEKLNTSELVSFWAPFLLLHLGGPDTITAYSLEDNELWLRHLLEVVFQSGVALYILLLSWPGCSDLPLLSILVYIVGFIKCYERIQALRLANTEHLRDSMLGSPDPGPNYPKFLEDYHLRKRMGHDVSIGEVPEAPLPVTDHACPSRGDVISEAYALFQTFKRIFVDLILAFEDKDQSQSYFRHLTSIEAFTAVEIELGFAYDMLYTKAKVVYTFVGLVIRLTSVFILLMASMGFYFLCDVDEYRVIDVSITYLLFATAIIMEIFSVITMLRSDWTDVWLSQHNYSRDVLILPFLKKKPTKVRWSNSIAQVDLLSFALEEKPASLLTTQKFLGIDKYRVKHRYKTYSKASNNLKDLIYKQFHVFMSPSSDPKALCSHKGSFSLRENGCDDLLWSITKVEFDQSIIIWHIATTLCYYTEDLDEQDQGEINVCRLESKRISDYMLYLLVSYPVMLTEGIGLIRYRDTCAEATRYFKENGPITEKVEACRKLLEVYCPDVLPSQVKGDRCKSALFDGCRLAFTLKNMEEERMWKVMSQVWIEILAYAATHCRAFQHEQQLRKGGEFLTHVWLLMAHLGITEQFQSECAWELQF
ncbi:hypothetical protein L1987_39676 [Smallanthus sonchifolius]|uniref:Uncharacterized protein n=1 Tax=Smallanthus sonchifolius TaxID=185202 RepID=A0ACB9HM14_9ASTR|nr:hypothetical protein L1987_39676 [Smallanthus sonchifolius]